jgi:hypothetical protein
MIVQVIIAAKKKQKQLKFSAECQVLYHGDAAEVWRMIIYLHFVSKLSLLVGYCCPQFYYQQSTDIAENALFDT